MSPAAVQPLDSPAPPNDDVAVRAADLSRFLADHDRVAVLTGAGCSTESGIPDYRGPDGSWRHHKPMSFRELTGSRRARRRYWARSTLGWRRIADAEPNPAHRVLARLERAGIVPVLISQNVDGLHQKAGHRNVVDLHGRLDRVECLDCHTGYRREPFQDELTRLNPDWGDAADTGRRTVRPDGDVDLPDADYDAFRLPTCPRCGGDLKPGVVFFGEAVPRRRTEAAYAAVAAADALLVVGSSLMVWSGYRFAREAVRAAKPLALLNLGRTRADGEATLKVEGRCGEVLAAVAAQLGV